MRTKTGNGHNLNIEKFIEDLKAVVQDGQDLLQTGFGEVRERALTGVKTTNRIVQEHPYQSLGVVFGLGVLVGLLATGLITRGAAMEEDGY